MVSAVSWSMSSTGFLGSQTRRVLTTTTMVLLRLRLTLLVLSKDCEASCRTSTLWSRIGSGLRSSNGPEIIERLGGFNIVGPGLLLIGMVSLFEVGELGDRNELVV